MPQRILNVLEQNRLGMLFRIERWSGSMLIIGLRIQQRPRTSDVPSQDETIRDLRKLLPYPRTRHQFFLWSMANPSRWLAIITHREQETLSPAFFLQLSFFKHSFGTLLPWRFRTLALHFVSSCLWHVVDASSICVFVFCLRARLSVFIARTPTRLLCDRCIIFNVTVLQLLIKQLPLQYRRIDNGLVREVTRTGVRLPSTSLCRVCPSTFCVGTAPWGPKSWFRYWIAETP